MSTVKAFSENRMTGVLPSHLPDNGPSTSHWYVLQSKSRQEKALASTLMANNIDHYLPLVRKARYYGRRKVSVDAPLFPGYVFLNGSLEQTYDADRTKRVARIIPVADQIQLGREIRSIREALAQEATLDRYPHLKEGIRVEVRAGPFQGIQGLVEAKTNVDRLILQIDVLGQATSLEIDSALLDMID